MAKSFKAVFNPELFAPMPKVLTPENFEKKWAVNDAAVLANMAHAAYLDRNSLSKLITGGTVGARGASVNSQASPNELATSREAAP